MIGVQDLRRGHTYIEDEQIWRVIDYSHSKLGRGNASIRLKVRNVRAGSTVDKTYQSGSRVQDVQLDREDVQYLYHDGDLYYFMNSETYEQPALSASVLGEAVYYLTDGLTLELVSYKGEPIGIELPTSVDLEVTQTEPGFPGDTATGGTKPAIVKTGLKVQVPLFIRTGFLIRIDTRTGQYLTRV